VPLLQERPDGAADILLLIPIPILILSRISIPGGIPIPSRIRIIPDGRRRPGGRG
jgi:hypothetical protein